MSESRFHVSFGIAAHGWLPVVVATDAKQLDLVASRVLNDPLDELVGVAVELAGESAVSAVVRIWEEPDTTELRFLSGPAAQSVTIEITEYGDWFGSPGSRRAVVYSSEHPRQHLAATLIASLRAFEATTPRSGEVEGWGQFPSAKLRQVAPARNMRTFVKPWREVRGLQRITDELRIEVGKHHPLYDVEAAIVGHFGDTDEYLFELKTGPDQLAVVKLTWSGKRESEPNTPATQFYSSWQDWLIRRALLDADAGEGDDR